jgi:type IV secretion system protein VirD4
MMVSRQETQRHLLTPGEVMQLPPDKEVVMVSGTPPVLAKKLRYFEDGNFKGRVLPPSNGAIYQPTTRSDWSGHLVDAEPSADDTRAMALDKNDRELKQEVQREHCAEPAIEKPEGPEPDQDAIDPADSLHLDAVRRIMGLGEVDEDFSQER